MMPSRRFFLAAATAATLQHSSVAQADSAQKPPILLVVADDLGFNDVGFQTPSFAVAKTPNLNALAREGVVFTNHHVQPFCSPTRAALQVARLRLSSPARRGTSAAELLDAAFPTDWPTRLALWPAEHGDLAPRPMGPAAERDLFVGEPASRRLLCVLSATAAASAASLSLSSSPSPSDSARTIWPLFS